MLPIDRLREFVASRRGQLKLSQVELADAAGVAKGTVSMLESGQLANPPKRETLKKLAKGLQIPAQTLYDLAEGKEPSVAAPPTIERPTHGEHPVTDLEWGIIEQATRMGISVHLDGMPGILDVPPDHPMRRELFWGIAEAVKQSERLRRWSEEQDAN
jgi:transcriptional regulator with XRE-family HTH domain